MNQVHEIWVIDDARTIRDMLRKILLDAGYEVAVFQSAQEALEKLTDHSPHVIISDIIMPDMDGLTFMDRIHEMDREMPVILITAAPHINVTMRAIKGGAFDFITKPATKEQILLCVHRATTFCEMVFERRCCREKLERMVLERTAQLESALRHVKESKLETVHVLTRTTEYRDNETAAHIRRIGSYSHRLAKTIGMDNDFCEDILYASPMHDIGKIGMPDSLLLKSGPLSREEFKVMQKHTDIGASMLSGSKSGMLVMAREIALCHHERWDGSGYPHGLKGEEIPLTGRIVMLVDQYDALRSKRPYKDAYTHERTMQIMTRGNTRTRTEHFDPHVLEAFQSIESDFDTIFREGSGGGHVNAEVSDVVLTSGS